MISDRAIGLAVERDIITSDQAKRLSRLQNEVTNSGTPESDDDEKLRFVTGFADIFVTIGIVLFLGALAFLMDAGTGSTLMYAGVAACAWLLAEFFTGQRRMALPSIVLLLVFVSAVYFVSLQIVSSVLPPAMTLSDKLFFFPRPNPVAGLLAALVATGMAELHYIRFHVPITVAAGAATLSLLALGLATLIHPTINDTGINLVLFFCGLAVFGLAMRFDITDPARVTRRTDIAFWLHLLAAPLIVHPLVEGFLHGLDVRLTTAAALGILWVFLLLGLVAVVIDRRAILVSGLVYAGIAFSTIFRTLGVVRGDFLLPTVLLALGAFILLLSAGWGPLRRAILKRLPAALAGRLPHPLVTSQA